MPMVVLTHRVAPEKCNWAVEELNPICEDCARVIDRIVERASSEYDINDPVSIPFFPLPQAGKTGGARLSWR